MVRESLLKNEDYLMNVSIEYILIISIDFIPNKTQCVLFLKRTLDE